VESEEQQKKQSWLLKTTGCVSVKDKKYFLFPNFGPVLTFGFFSIRQAQTSSWTKYTEGHIPQTENLF
jgi:hypothetical protein